MKTFLHAILSTLFALKFQLKFNYDAFKTACERDNRTIQTISRVEGLSDWLSRLTFRTVIANRLIILQYIHWIEVIFGCSPFRAFRRRRTRRPSRRNSIVFSPVVISLLSSFSSSFSFSRKVINRCEILLRLNVWRHNELQANRIMIV